MSTLLERAPLAPPRADGGRAVVTVGNFDGVHRGHRSVIRHARRTADLLGLDRVLAVTFDPHPLLVLRPDRAPRALSTVDERVALLREAGVDDVLVLPFDRRIASWSPVEFVDRILVGGAGARAVVVGDNFRFGNRAAGDVALLTDLGAQRNFVARGVPVDGEGPHVWSSTRVRNCLAAGDVAAAAETLGRPFSLAGTVFSRPGPTVTISVPAPMAVPAAGRYRALVRLRAGAPEVATAVDVLASGPEPAGHLLHAVLPDAVLPDAARDRSGDSVTVSFLARLGPPPARKH
ncbi:MAG TPA: adenylyltransferase/cytidyltransferase family protein [Pseudonocardia sp.]